MKDKPTDNPAVTLLILKYGSMMNAYRAWCDAGIGFRCPGFSEEDERALHEFGQGTKIRYEI